jgi:hypothetical protein
MSGDDVEPDSPAREERGGDVTAVRDVFGAVSTLGRIGWFALGALVATTITLIAMTRPWAHRRDNSPALPYEVFPFADNAGVCQEWVALASVQTSHDDAVAIVRRLAPQLPSTLRADNLRVVRAFAAGDWWTIAVDAQPGAGDAEGARTVANTMNGLPGTGMRFDATFYSSRRLYETARVLCMPRATVSP